MVDDKRDIMPNQAVSYASKIANDFEWAKGTIDAIINSFGYNNDDNDVYEKLARVRDGKLIEQDYAHVLNPFNTANENYKRFPAKIRNYPLVGPVCDLLLGELGDRPRIEQVIAVNSDVTNEKKEKINIAIEVGLKQQFINKLNSLGIDTGVESKQVDIQQIISQINETFDDKLSIQGQEALDFLYYDLDLDDKYAEAFDDFLTWGECYTYKDINFDNVEHEVVSPRDFRYSNNNVKFVEECDYVRRKVKFTKSQYIKKFYNELTEKEVKDSDAIHIDNPFITHALPFRGRIESNGTSDNEGKDNFNDSNYLHGYHVAWQALKREGKLTYIDKETGQITETTVNDTYKFDKKAGDIDIKWYWITEWWEGYRMGESSDNTGVRYHKIRPVPAQRNVLNECATNKGPYNGIVRQNRTKEITSICNTGYTFQVLFNTYHFQHEKIMNKNKDKIVMFPLGLIPTNAGWDEDRFMYTATNLSFAFYNDKAPGAAAQLQGIKVLDLGLSEYAAKMYEVIQQIKAEFWDAIGMNRQRFGDIMTSDGKGNTEQAIVRSAIVSQELFRKFDKFKEKEANGLIDLSRLAWINGKRGAYLNSDGTLKTLEVIGWEHSLTEYGVFAKNSAKEYRKVNESRALALPILQNDGKLSTVLEMQNTDNFSKIQNIVNKAEKAREDYEKYVKEQELKQVEAQIAAKDKEQAIKSEDARYIADMNYQAAVDSATIRSEDSGEDGLEREKFNKDNEFKSKKLELENKKINNQDKQASKKLSQTNK